MLLHLSQVWDCKPVFSMICDISNALRHSGVQLSALESISYLSPYAQNGNIYFQRTERAVRMTVWWRQTWWDHWRLKFGWGRGLSAWNVSVINQYISCDVLMVHSHQYQIRTCSINDQMFTSTRKKQNRLSLKYSTRHKNGSHRGRCVHTEEALMSSPKVPDEVSSVVKHRDVDCTKKIIFGLTCCVFVTIIGTKHQWQLMLKC